MTHPPMLAHNILCNMTEGCPHCPRIPRRLMDFRACFPPYAHAGPCAAADTNNHLYAHTYTHIYTYTCIHKYKQGRLTMCLLHFIDHTKFISNQCSKISVSSRHYFTQSVLGSWDRNSTMGNNAAPK